MRLLLDVFVPGAPKTKGSVESVGTFMPKVKRAIAALRSGNAAVALRELQSIDGRTYVKQAVVGSADWSKLMEYRARQAWADRPARVDVPIRGVLTYYLPVTPARLLRQGSGDIDKLERNVLDALTKAGVYGDDAQVVGVAHEKVAILASDGTPVAGLVQGVRITFSEDVGQ